jgi:hypothetical protein
MGWPFRWWKRPWAWEGPTIPAPRFSNKKFLHKVGIVACLQTHGSLANWHPHLHLVVTDGGFRPDGTFVRWPGWPSHDTLQLTEAFRRAVLRLSPCGWRVIAPGTPWRWSG